MRRGLRSIVMLGSAAFVALAAVGCVGQTGDEGAEGETIAESTEALGEAGCETVAATPATNVGVCDYGYTISPSTYGSTSCPGQFDVSYANNNAHGVKATAIWDGPFLTNATICNSAHISLGMYAQDPFSGSWSVETETWAAHWSGERCTWSVDSGSGAGSQLPLAVNYRFAAEAWTVGTVCYGANCILNGRIQQKVEVGVRSYPTQMGCQ